MPPKDFKKTKNDGDQDDEKKKAARANWPRYRERITASEAFQKSFDLFVRKQPNNYATIVQRWEAYTMLPLYSSSAELTGLLHSMLEYCTSVWMFRGFFDNKSRELVLRRRRVVFLRMCALLGQDPFAEGRAGFRQADTLNDRLYFARGRTSGRAIRPRDAVEPELCHGVARDHAGASRLPLGPSDPGGRAPSKLVR